MKWVVLAGLLGWPGVAGAQETPTPQQAVDSALEIAAVAHRLVECGIRDESWAQGIYILALGNTGGAVADLEKSNLSVTAGLKIWRDITFALTTNTMPTPQDCAGYAANTNMLTNMDALARVGGGN